MIRDLDGANGREILARAVSALEDITGSDKISIYALTDSRSVAVLSAKSDKRGFAPPTALKVRDRQDIREVLETKQIFVNRDLVPDLPAMAAPIHRYGQVAAVVIIQALPFENLTLHNYNRLKVAVDIISGSYARAERDSGGFTEKQSSGPGPEAVLEQFRGMAVYHIHERGRSG